MIKAFSELDVVFANVGPYKLFKGGDKEYIVDLTDMSVILARRVASLWELRDLKFTFTRCWTEPIREQLIFICFGPRTPFTNWTSILK